MGYVGRFAPSPTGPLHAGSLVAALASWLDARAHKGMWLVRIEDIDQPRCPPGADRLVLEQLSRCGLVSDVPVVYQSARGERYQTALEQLLAAGRAYPCGCTRLAIAQAWAAQGVHHTRHQTVVYPGTCRNGLQGATPRAWRFKLPTPDPELHWTDRRLGRQTQSVSEAVGDFVLRRADGLWAYQLAVVVDDAAQGVTDVVRGIDLADNTPRQIRLQQALGLQTLRYLHTPLVLNNRGEKLSKQAGAAALDLDDPVAALQAAARVLGLPAAQGSVPDVLACWVRALQSGTSFAAP
ncbi:MAG: Glutamyl-Q tRNA(Asp) synthetase [Pseudomonadota bacterium]